MTFFQEFSAKFKNENYHSCVDIGSCSLCIAHGTFRTSAEKSECALKKLLKGAYMILHNTPARMENLQPILALFAQQDMNCLDYHCYISKMCFCLFLVKRFELTFLNYLDLSIILLFITYSYLLLIISHSLIVTYQFSSQFK